MVPVFNTPGHKALSILSAKEQEIVAECSFLGQEKCFEKHPGFSSIFFKMLVAEVGGESEFKKGMKEVKNAPSSIKASFNEKFTPYCKDFLGTPEYKKGNKDYPGYIFCCETLDFCSFYVQTWFFIVCGVVGLLLLVGIAGAVFFFYRKRKRMGK